MAVMLTQMGRVRRLCYTSNSPRFGYHRNSVMTIRGRVSGLVGQTPTAHQRKIFNQGADVPTSSSENFRGFSVVRALRAAFASAVLLFASGFGLAQSDTKPSRSGGGGGGFGINIDIGSIFNALRDQTNKDERCSTEVENSARTQYLQIAARDMSVEQFVAQSCEAYKSQQLKRNNLLSGSQSRAQTQKNTKLSESCKVNGNFESGNLASWAGMNNGLGPRTAISRTNISTAGITSGTLAADSSHQTIVTSGNDPLLGALLQQVRPGGGGSAVRIGNSATNFGAELLSKSFKVSPADAVIGFAYAVVLQNPLGHSANDQPAFMVRVLNSAGNDITNNLPGGRVQLMPGFQLPPGTPQPNMLVADAGNPFFKKFTPGNILYKDWSCAEINLSDLIGQDVTIEFITLDCGQGAHFGYAYIDDFCSACGPTPEGWIKLAETSVCGEGQVCIDVGIPKTDGAIGQATVALDIWQNGTKLTTYTSATLNADGKTCFPINPGSIPGLDLTKGFDYSAQASFQIGGYLLPNKLLGAGPDGLQVGQNNDYASTCTATTSCGQPGQPPCPSCGTLGQPPCPACGQVGQPPCPPCGQPGQPLCAESCLNPSYPVPANAIRRNQSRGQK